MESLKDEKDVTASFARKESMAVEFWIRKTEYQIDPRRY